MGKSGPLTFSFMATRNVALTYMINVEEIKPDIHIPFLKEASKGLFPGSFYTRERLLYNTALRNQCQFYSSRMHRDD